MAGHSHASNVKHKKDRNDRLKSETFLKLRKKIELIIINEKNYDKVFALARENNFPKEKVNSIIEKIKNKKPEQNTFYKILYKSKFDIILCLEGFFGEEAIEKINEISEFFNLEKITNKSWFDYFESLFSLRVKWNDDFENFIFSSFSSSIIDKINKIEQLNNCDLNFEITFSEKQARDEVFEYLKLQSEIVNFELKEYLLPFSSIILNSNDSVSYFLLLKEKLFEIDKDLKIFTNVFLKGKEGP